MSDPRIGDTGDQHPVGYEGYPFASPEAEKRIKLVTSIISVTAVAFLAVGLYLALFTTNVVIGGVLALVGFVDLLVVPILSKHLRRGALSREGGGIG